MGDVDKNNALVGNFRFIQKGCKWYIKIFHFFEESIFNKYVFNCKNDTSSKQICLQFKLDAICTLHSHAKLEEGLQNVTGCTKDCYLPLLIPPTKRNEKP